MDNSALRKYFNLGDLVEISMLREKITGTIVDFSDNTIVIEDNDGNPIVVSLDNVLSCRKRDNGNSQTSISESVPPTTADNNTYNVSKINEAITSLERIYEVCDIHKEYTISTNAKVVNNSSSMVEVLTDDGQSIECVKSSFVGYSREKAAIGNRVFCIPSKNGISYSTLSEMSYAELYERFVRAINTKPVPRSTIIGSILHFLTKEYGNTFLPEKKKIKQLIRKLNGVDNEEATGSPIISKRLKNSELNEEQKRSISDLLNEFSSQLLELEGNDQIKYADALIFDRLGFKIRRISLKSMLSGIVQYQAVVDSESKESVGESGPKDLDDPYLPATAEVIKYYPKYSNGTLKDGSVDGIRFRDDVVIDDELKISLNSCWSTPIPVICTYKMIGKWNVASFVTKPGTLRELRSKIITLRSSGNNDLADSLSDYIENTGHFVEPEIQVDLSLSSPELLSLTRRQRLIKNFKQAENGFLELISRNYEFDAVIRDLAAMYQECYGANKAIEILEKYLPNLEEKVKTYNQLSLLYQSVGDKDKAISVMEKALELIPASNKANLKKIEKLKKRISHLKKGKNVSDTDNNIEADNQLNLLTSLDIPSEFVRYDASNQTNNVLAFVKDKSQETKIHFVRQRIAELKDSPELPLYYLARVQLIDGTDELSAKQKKNLLADYCRAKARNHFNEGNIISAREYLLEGISLCEREDLYYLLFLSLTTSNTQDILSKYNVQFKSYEEIVEGNNCIIEEYDVYYVLLRMVAHNTVLSRKLLKCLYHSDSIDWICEELEIENKHPEVFVNTIFEEANRYAKDFISFEDELSSVMSISNAVEFSNALLNLQIPVSKEINSVDTGIVSLAIEVANLAVDFSKNSVYEECEEISRNAVQKINNGISLIQQKPTHLSALRLLPILLKFKDLFERLLNKKYAETVPNIVVNAIDDARPIGDDVEIQLSVSNEDGFHRANNCILTVDAINGKDVSNLLLKRQFDSPLPGGAILTTNFTVKSSLLVGDEINVSYSFSYTDVRKVERVKKDQILLVVNKGNDYEDFDNPYVAHVKSNAVKDKSMFKGRDEIIDTICTYVLEDYKGYVLYGQKRSGKSSVLYHITQRLRKEHKAFAVEYTMGNNIVQDSENEKDSMANLFYTITSEIGRAIKEVDRKVYKEEGCHIIRRQEFETYPDQTFREYLDFYRDIIHDKLHYEQYKIVLIVDEFTYLYYHILEGKISPGIMEFWKGLIESKVFSFVFAGQDAMPRFMDEFQNVFASMHPQELTYIDEESARELIEQPIWNKSKNTSRYTEDAVNEIIKLTACSPFYIMILCSELVKFARQRKRIPIQVSDVNALVQKMICNESSISRKDFDNLISCGESRLDLIDKDDSLKVLKEIALKSRNVEYYDIGAITAFADKKKVRDIIEDLLRRGVLQRHPEFGSKVKIKVGLFKRWLLNHE